MEIIKKFDFIESFNACEGGAANAAAAALAGLYGKPVFGGSDSHRTNAAGMGYTIITDDIKNESELIDYIHAKKSTEAGGEFYMHTARSKIGPAKHVFNYLFWAYNKSMALVRTPERRGKGEGRRGKPVAGKAASEKRHARRTHAVIRRQHTLLPSPFPLP